LTGLLVDEVKQVSSVYEVSDEEDLDYRGIWETMLSAKQLVASQDSEANDPDQRYEALWRTMIGDLVMSEYPVERANATHAPDFREIESAFEKEDFPQLNRRPRYLGCSTNRLFESLCGMMANHAFFITKKGYLGMGPPTTSPGDQVWVFYDGNVPFVMREGDTDNVQKGRHKLHLVGDAYVHGIMDGQAVVDEHETQTAFIY
jgi:hypothetical protein